MNPCLREFLAFSALEMKRSLAIVIRSPVQNLQSGQSGENVRNHAEEVPEQRQGNVSTAETETATDAMLIWRRLRAVMRNLVHLGLSGQNGQSVPILVEEAAGQKPGNAS